MLTVDNTLRFKVFTYGWEHTHDVQELSQSNYRLSLPDVCKPSPNNVFVVAIEKIRSINVGFIGGGDTTLFFGEDFFFFFIAATRNYFFFNLMLFGVRACDFQPGHIFTCEC